ncbi:LIC_13387 family protein [Mucilaginibacter panaciglaebae]|uniref:DUF4064 domain-containing protein n=1 Tax=Mucilaginibacter panaciglaebae TaxID=502331 RepID=A0ABP7WX22_9SPHI
MSAKLSLRIAAVLILLHAFGHTFGTLGWKKAPNAQVGNVINDMQNIHFQFMGRQVSFANFYEGYGISMIFVLLLVAALLWHFSYSIQAKPIAFLTIFLLLLAFTEYVYFFSFAAAFSLLAGVCAGLSLLQKSKKATP